MAVIRAYGGQNIGRKGKIIYTDKGRGFTIIELRLI